MIYLFLIIFGVLSRFLPHLPNFTPLGAIALFGGSHFKNKKEALVLPLIIMLITDAFLGFHNMMIYVYSCFLFTAFLGIIFGKKPSAARIFSLALFNSLTFFLITNFGVWLSTGFYPKTLAGLINCYFLALPFFRNSLLGDLFYSGILFGSFKIILHSNLYHAKSRITL